MGYELFHVVEKLSRHLEANGIEFREGYPILPQEMILTEEPEEIIPFEHRNACQSPASTVLCHFSNDEQLYRRLGKIDDDIEVLKKYQGVTGFDLSPRLGFDPTLQEFNLVLNRMLDAYRALNGVKILPNFRTGGLSSLNSLHSYPVDSLMVVGTLGCARGFVAQNTALLNAKLIYSRPKKLLIYGPLKEEYKIILDEFGQPYRHYVDFQKNSRRKGKVA